jgi:anti-anti-sigma factor
VPSATLTTHLDPAAGTLHVAGEIDISSRVAFRMAVMSALTEHVGDLKVDLSGVTFIDGGGIDELLACSSRARLHHTRLRVVNPSRPALRLMRITGTERLLLDGRTRAAERKLRIAGARAPSER